MTLLLTVEDLTGADLVRHLQRSPSISGTRGAAAITLLATAAGGTLLDAAPVRRALTVDGGRVYIDWSDIARESRGLLSSGSWSTYRRAHPDAGIVLALAAGLATGQLTESGLTAITEALAGACGEPAGEQR